MKHKNFQTSNFGLATVLNLYFKLEEIDRSYPQRSEFCFERTKRLDEIVEQFYEGSLLVEPKKFLFSQKELKSRLYSEIRPP